MTSKRLRLNISPTVRDTELVSVGYGVTFALSSVVSEILSLKQFEVMTLAS